MSDFVIENGTLIRYTGSNTDVVIPEMIDNIKVTKIGEKTFYWNNSITSIKLPSSITEIEYGTFWGCGSLKSITLPSNLTSIGESAFLGCKSLKSIELPNSVAFIGNSAFERCTSLASINFAGTVDQWNSIFKNFQWLDGFPTNGIVCSDGVVTTE